MIHLSGISKSFGARTLFNGLDWHIKKNEQIGLVGPNGAGKTTLLRIVAGEIASDDGTVSAARATTIGYLPQELVAIRGTTVRQEARRGLQTVLDVGKALSELESRLASPSRDGGADGGHAEDLDGLMKRYGELQARFEMLGGFRVDSQVEEVLDGLGFRAADFDRDCGELSGGWQMRVALARLLLMRPGVLLLDEPTNHLDLESVEWLEAFLKGHGGSLVLISHDRMFLDRLCTHIAELSSASFELYTGNFEAYLEQAAQRQALLERQHKNQARKRAEMSRFIDRFRYKATKARQVQSRIRLMEKLEHVELKRADATIHFTLPEPVRCGRVVLELDNIEQAYGDQVIYSGLDVTLTRGRKIVLVGPNGAGKSTLLKLMAGVVPYRRGRRELGHRVHPYYFAQHQIDALDMRRTLFEEACTGATGQTPLQVRSILGAFLFSGEDINKGVAVLSGGEKNRLALAKMLMAAANVLLLDEPTTHLDMASRAVLEAAIASYSGTVVMISHDRHFIDAIVDEVWEVRDGCIVPHLGNYSDYQRRRESGDVPEPIPTRADPSGGASPNAPSDLDAAAGNRGRRRKTKDEKRREAVDRQARAARTRDVRVRVDRAEASAQGLEARLSELRALQADPEHYADPQAVGAIARQVASAEAELAAAYVEWEAASIQLEELGG